MTSETLEERLTAVESELDDLRTRMNQREPQKRGWRWFVGVLQDNPRFDEAVKAGEEWRDSYRLGIRDVLSDDTVRDVK